MHDLMNLNNPQRLNSLGYILAIIKTFVSILKQFIFVIAYMLYKQREVLLTPYFWLIILGLLFIVAFIAFLNFRSFKYYVDESAEEFVVTKGVWSKSKIVIKFANIIQVNITQNVIQKALSLYSLTLDTGGSDKVEVDLYALDGEQATELKILLLSKIDGNPGTDSHETHEIITKPVSSQEIILSLPTRNILLFSLLSGYRQGLALFFAFLVTIFQQFDDAFRTFEFDEEDVNAEALKQLALNSLILFVVVTLVIIVVIPFVINLVRYYLKYYNFNIVRNKKENFNMQYGLLKQVNTIFNKDKIHLLHFKQNQILKRIGIGLLSVKQLVTDVTKEAKSNIELPGITIEDKQKVYTLAFGAEVFEQYETLKPHIGFFINKMVKISVFYGILIIVLLLLDYYLDITIPLIIALFLGHSIYNFLLYQSYTLKYNSDFLIKNYGVWNEKEVVIPMLRVQGVEISQSFFQRRSKTMNFYVSTAAKQISFKFFKQSIVNGLANHVLYKVEK